MTRLDYAVVALFLACMALIGIVIGRRIKGLEDYFAAGRRMPWWMAAISHHVSGYSAWAFVGLAGICYTVGLNSWTFFAFPCFVAVTVGAFVWAPRWVRLKVITPVEYLERRFNPLVHQWVAWSGIAVKFVDVGTKLFSLGLLISICAGVPLNVTIVACGVVAVLYTVVGGLWAGMVTDIVQFFIQVAITVILAVLALYAVGGWTPMWEQLPPAHHSFFSRQYDLPFILVYIAITLLSYNGGTWGLAQRYYSVGKPADARKAALLSAALYLLYPVVIFIPVWAAPLVLGTGLNPEETYGLMARHFLPKVAPGMLGLFLAGMAAATMSMIDSDINALAAVFTQDIYHRRFNPRAPERTVLRVGLVASGVIGAITIGAALLTPAMGGAFKAMLDWYAALLAPVAVPLLLGMLTRRTSWRGALAAWVAGFGTFAALKYGAHASWTVYTGGELLAAVGVFLAEGALFKMPPDEAARAARVLDQVSGRT